MPLRPTGRCKPEYRDVPHPCGPGCVEWAYEQDPLIHALHVIVDGHPVEIRVEVDIEKIVRRIRKGGIESIYEDAIVSDFVELIVKGED